MLIKDLALSGNLYKLLMPHSTSNLQDKFQEKAHTHTHKKKKKINVQNHLSNLQCDYGT